MKEFIINQIIPGVDTIIATAVTAILVFVIKKIGSPIVDILALKKKEAEIKLENTGYKTNFDKALEVWHIVDDKFRLTENAIDIFGSKEKLFEDLLLNRVPGLTQRNINDLRDAVSGEINKGREKLIKDDKDIQLEELKGKCSELENKNNELQSKFDKINNYINSNPTKDAQATQQLSESTKNEDYHV